MNQPDYREGCPVRYIICLPASGYANKLAIVNNSSLLTLPAICMPTPFSVQVSVIELPDEDKVAVVPRTLTCWPETGRFARDFPSEIANVVLPFAKLRVKIWFPGAPSASTPCN